MSGATDLLVYDVPVKSAAAPFDKSYDPIHGSCHFVRKHNHSKIAMCTSNTISSLCPRIKNNESQLLRKVIVVVAMSVKET